MSDRSAFLRHIAEHPHADLPRLVFADWLDERDDPLGQFIRVQIDLDPIRDQIELPRVRELLSVEEELLREHEDEWLEPLQDLAPDWDRRGGPYFRRGFPHAVCLYAHELLEDGKRWMKAFPTIRELAVTGMGEIGEEVGSHPFLRRIDTLEIVDLPDQGRFSELIGGKNFGRVPVVRLWNASFGSCALFHITPGDWKPGGTVEYVQLLGGQAAGAEAEAHDQEADECAAEFNAVWGEGVVRVVRPYRRLFPFHQDEETFSVGRLPDGQRAVVFLPKDSPHAAVNVFDENGFAGTRHVPYPTPHEWDTFQTWLRDGLRLTPQSIRIPEFEDEFGQGVQLWKQGDADRLRRDEISEVETWEWLYNRRHVVAAHGNMGDYWADSRGFVTDS